MIGDWAVFICLDADQGYGWVDIDGRQQTLINDTYAYTLANLGLDQSYPISFNYRYGRDRFIVGDFETGTATLVLDNDTGEWTPASGVNTIGGDKLQPGMIVVVQHALADAQLAAGVQAATGDTWTASATAGFAKRDLTDTETTTGFVDGRTWTNHGSSNDLLIGNPADTSQTQFGAGGYTRFVGRVVSIRDEYDEGGRGAITVVELVDFMADLAAYSDGTQTWGAETTSARWLTIWLAAINDGNMIGSTDTGVFTMKASNDDSNYLEEARVAARAEGGAVFAAHGESSGRLLFKNANWLVEDPRSAVIQVSIGNSRYGIHTASTEYSLLTIYNDIDYDNGATVTTSSDATSIADFSTRTLTKTVLNNSNTDLGVIADRDLAMLKDAQLIINTVTIKPNNVFEELWARQVTVGDLIEVTIPIRDWSYTQQLHVAGVSEMWTVDDWTLELRLDSRDGDYSIEPGV